MSKSKNQTGLFNPENEYAKKKIVIIWVWGVWSVASYYITQMWCSNVTVVDMDEVEIHNTASQFYKQSDCWKKKVEAIAENLLLFNDVSVSYHHEAYNKSHIEWADIVVIAVDNMDIRADIVNDCFELDVDTVIESRMSWEFFSIHTFNPMTQIEDRKWFWYPQSEADPEVCTMKSISYNTWMIGAMIAKLVRDTLTEKDTPFLFQANLWEYKFMSC